MSARKMIMRGPGGNRPGRWTWAGAMAAGWSAGLAQVVILREVMVLAGGDELSLGLCLAVWLLAGAGASFLAGRLAGERPLEPGDAVLLAAAGAFLSLFLSRLAPAWLGLFPGEEPSLLKALMLTLLAAGPAAAGAGAAFPLLLAAARGERMSRPSLASWLYGLEALGHTLGALLFALVLAGLLNPVAVLSLTGLAAGALGLSGGPSRRIPALSALALSLCLLVFSSPLNLWLMECQWPGREIVSTRESPYARLTVTRAAGQTDFFAGGNWLFSLPSRDRLERRALLPLLAQPHGLSALFLGGGAEGAAALAAQMGGMGRVDVVELDPWLVEERREAAEPPGHPPGFRLLIGDGRVWLERLERRYDLVAVLEPPPSTLALNRFYSLEGLRALSRLLEPGGVLVLCLPGMENLVGELGARRLGVILSAAREVFPRRVILSGPEMYLCLGSNISPLSSDPEVWLDRLSRRRWPDFAALSPGEIRRFLAPLGVSQILSAVEATGPHPPNHDLAPRALLFDPGTWGVRLYGAGDLALWLAGLRPSHLFIPLLVLAALLLLAGRRERPWGRPSLLGLFVMGFTSLALSVCLMALYQAACGAVYVGLALLSAGFMLGLGLSSLRLAFRPPRSGPEGLALLSGITGALCLSLGPLSRWVLAQGDAWWGMASMAALACTAGVLAGSYFALAANIRLGGSPRAVEEGGRLYGLDLLGGALGALAPLLFLPTVGFWGTMVFLGGLNLVALAGLAGSIWLHPGGRGTGTGAITS